MCEKPKTKNETQMGDRMWKDDSGEMIVIMEKNEW